MRRKAKESAAQSARSKVGLRALASIVSVCAPAVIALLATSASAAAAGCPNEAIREQQASTSLPDCRAYEMVSPLDKGSRDVTRDVITLWATSRAAADGSAVAFTSFGAFADSQGAALYNQYRSERGPGGWSTRGANPPLDPGVMNTQNPFTLYLSEDLSTSVVLTKSTLLPGTALLGGSWPLHLQHFGPGGSTYDLLTSPWQPLPPDSASESSGDQRERFDFGASSSDMKAVVFVSLRKLTADGPPDEAQALYLWREGEVELVSVLPDGTPAPLPAAGSDRLFGGGRANVQYNGNHIVSDDGEKVFFQADVPGHGRPLFVREGGAVTRLVSSSEKTGADPTEPVSVTFAGASADGSSAVFAAGEQLTDDTAAGGNLYHWDGTAPPGSRLEAITPSAAAPDAFNTPMLSEDASVVYFVAAGAPLAPGAVADTPNLYLWRQGNGVRFVATLLPTDQQVWTKSREGTSPRAMRITADGDRLAFVSAAQLTEYDNDGHRQVYLYDASEDRIRCVSCSPIAPVATGDAAMFVVIPNGHDQAMPVDLPRNLSDEGSRVFFETAQKLVPRDVNGLTDVYMWEGGEIHLVSSGESDDISQFIDASESGDDVFFATRQALVGGDTDRHVDVYDARVGGGFLEPPTPANCLGESCQPDSSPSAGTGPGTVGFKGAGNSTQPSRKRCGKRKRAVTKGGRTRCVRKGRSGRAKREKKRAKRCAHKHKRYAKRRGKARCVVSKGRSHRAKHERGGNR